MTRLASESIFTHLKCAKILAALTARRHHRASTRLRTLEIVQNEAPAHASTAPAVVRDDLGELCIQVSSPRQRFLEAFRLRSEHASAIDPTLRQKFAQRLIAEYGSARAAADALWTLARENEWYREGEGAERFLLAAPTRTERVDAGLRFEVAWHGHGLGELRHDGFEWSWQPTASAELPPLVRETKPGRLPAFIESLSPEGWLENVLADRDDRDALRRGRRYMSNISIVPAGERGTLPPDILKPAGTSGFESLPLVEWMCLELGRAAGFEAPTTALLAMPDGMPPALLVERFDIRRSKRDARLWALEDFCSLLDLPASAKYDATIERAAKALRALSSDPTADLETLLRRAIFAWLIGDGDMHLKNLALLKLARVGSASFASARMVPLYDAVSTRVFPKLSGDRMALKLHGKDDRLTSGDFVAAAKTMGLSAATAEQACREVSERVEAHLAKLHLPTFARRGTKAVRDALTDLVRRRVIALRG